MPEAEKDSAAQEGSLFSKEDILEEATVTHGLFKEAYARLQVFDKAIDGPTGWLKRHDVDFDDPSEDAAAVIEAWYGLPNIHELKEIAYKIEG